MQGSNLPIWLEVLLGGLILIVLMGLFTPYVSAEDQEKARRVPKVVGTKYTGNKVTICVRSRMDIGTLVGWLMPVFLFLVDVIFISEDFNDMVEAVEVEPVVDYFLMLFGMLLFDAIVWIASLFVLGIVMSSMERGLVKYYTDNFNVVIENNNHSLNN